MIRIGHGFDAHRFATGRPLFLGGVLIPYALGLSGHSDADVVIHAICDALLGAACLGDLGTHFPNTEAFKDIQSSILLSRVAGLIKEAGFQIENIDITIVAEAPKLSPYREAMSATLAQILNLHKNQVSLKATTSDGMGFTGRKEGIAAFAVALIHS